MDWGWFKIPLLEEPKLFLKIYLFILSAAGVSCGMRALHCSLWALRCGMHVGSSFLIRDRTWAPCIGNTESYPLEHQEVPPKLLVKFYFGGLALSMSYSILGLLLCFYHFKYC